MSRQTVADKARAIFPDLDPQEVLDALDRYGVEPYEAERERVQLAILKLCQQEGRATPDEYVEAAKRDYRDVLAWAEYPRRMRTLPGSPTPEEHAAITRADLEQYRDWLAG